MTELAIRVHERPRYFTRGVWILLVLVVAGAAAGLYRFFFGLEAATNLNDQYPWGLWIAIDVATGVALNRYNVFVLGYRPPYAQEAYVPALTEVAVTVGLISALVLVYRFLVFHLPVVHGFGGSKHE